MPNRNASLLNNFNQKKHIEFNYANRYLDKGFMLFEDGKLLSHDFKTGEQKYSLLNLKNVLVIKAYNGNIYFVKDQYLQSSSIKSGAVTKLAFVPQLKNCDGIFLFNNKFILISESGYAFIDTLSFKVNFYESFENSKKVNYNRISKMLCDEDGLLRFGTDGKGLRYASVYTNKFKNYQSQNNEENMIKGICTMPENKMVTAVYNQGIMVYNLDNSGNKKISGNMAFPNAANTQYTSVCDAGNDNVWVGKSQLISSGLFLVNIKTGIGKNYSSLIEKH